MVYMHKKTTMNRKMSDMKQKRRKERKRIVDDLRSIYIVDGSYVINRLRLYTHCHCVYPFATLVWVWVGVPYYCYYY